MNSFAEWNERILVLKERERLERKWLKRLEQLKAEVTAEEEQVSRWSARLADEEKDVERLTSMSLSNLIYSIFGKKEDRLEQEQLEVVEAKLKYDEAVRTLEETKAEMNEVVKLLRNVSGWESEYQQIMKQKERIVLQEDHELLEMAERKNELTMQMKELDEAIQAGQVVSTRLSRAAELLESAKNWGTYDMLGGGMLSTHIKHGKIDEAMEYVHHAQAGLRTFQKELQDVNMHTNVVIDIGEFLRFADYFFDGFIADWMVQGRIKDTLEAVENKEQHVVSILYSLNSSHNQLKNELNQLNQQYTAKIEQA